MLSSIYFYYYALFETYEINDVIIYRLLPSEF